MLSWIFGLQGRLTLGFALGAIGDMRCMPCLMQFVNDESIVVSQSCEVAIDLLNWVNSDSFEYS